MKKCRNVSLLPFHSKYCWLFAVAKINNWYDAVLGYWLAMEVGSLTCLASLKWARALQNLQQYICIQSDQSRYLYEPELLRRWPNENWLVLILLEAWFSLNLTSASLHRLRAIRVRSPIVLIWLECCWKGCKPQLRNAHSQRSVYPWYLKRWEE